MRYILGPLIIIGCVALMKYSVQVTNFTGKIEFAEQWLTYPLAGTYSLYKLVGLFIIVLCVMWLFGFLNFLPV